MITRYLHEKLYRTSITLFVVVVFIGIALNSSHERVRIRRWHAPSHPIASLSADETSLMSGGALGLHGWSEPESLGRHVGWPISMPLTESVSVFESSIVLRLLLNGAIVVLLGFASAAAVAGAQSIRLSWNHWPSVHRRRLRNYAIASGSAFLFAVVGVFFIGARTMLSQFQMRHELNRYGAVASSVDLPEMLAKQVPRTFLSPFLRIDSIRLESAPIDLLVRVQQRETLRSIGLMQCSIDESTWRQLISAPGLFSLSLSECKVRIDDEVSIDKPSSLRTLSLSRCEGFTGMMASLRQFPALTSFDVVGSPLSVPADTSQWLPKNLKHLRLPIKLAKNEKYGFTDMPELESLRLHSPNRPRVGERYRLVLQNLPKLVSLHLPPSSPLDLSLSAVPRLHRLDSPRFRAFSRDDESLSLPLPICKLTIDGAPSLQEFSLDPHCLESFSIKGTPNLRRLSIAMPQSHSNQWSVEFLSHFQEELRFGERASRWISGLAECDGPYSLDLNGLPLEGIDLSPLQHNKRIRELGLARTSVSTGQLLAIGPHLKMLDVQSCNIDAEQLRTLLEALPNAEQLIVDIESIDRLEIIDRPLLNCVLGSEIIKAKHVTISGSPNLAGHLKLGKGVRHLELTDASSLQALSVLGQLPPNTILKGLEDLEIVELGGENVTETHFAELLKCSQLSEITLAMPNISSASLREISRFSDLITLKLPGSQIDDEAVANWSSLTHLSDVDFSHTNITQKSIAVISQYHKIQRLKLNHTKLHATDMHLIENLPNLIELEVAGVGLTIDTLRLCLSSYLVDRIDLSNSLVTDEMVDLLASEEASHLLFIGLNQCALSENLIRRIAEANPRLAMDIEGNAVSAAWVSELARAGRIIPCHDRRAFERWIENATGNSGDETWLSSKQAKKEFGRKPFADWFSNPRELGRAHRPHRATISGFFGM